MFAVQVGLQDSDHGPVLDDSWPTVVRTEVRDSLCRLCFQVIKMHLLKIIIWLYQSTHGNQRISSTFYLQKLVSLASCPSGTAVTRMTAAYLTWHCRVWPTWWLESRYTHSAQRILYCTHNKTQINCIHTLEFKIKLIALLLCFLQFLSLCLPVTSVHNLYSLVVLSATT